METETTRIIAGYIALAVPATVAIAQSSKVVLEWLNQRHKIKTSRIEQTHQITTHYLDRALDPNVPLAIRQQLLRFLATPDKAGSRLSDWSKAELQRVENVVEETNRAVLEAEKELLAAKNNAEVAAAEKKLAFAASKRKSLLEPPKPPPVTAAALRAGLIKDENMTGLVMKDSDLRDMKLIYRNLSGADFSGSQISEGNFQGSDLRGSNFQKTDLSGCRFHASDLRGADLRGARLVDTNLREARLEGANLIDALLKNSDLRATYDGSTKWPDGFAPDEHGAVRVT